VRGHNPSTNKCHERNQFMAVASRYPGIKVTGRRPGMTQVIVLSNRESLITCLAEVISDLRMHSAGHSRIQWAEQMKVFIARALSDIFIELRRCRCPDHSAPAIFRSSTCSCPASRHVRSQAYSTGPRPEVIPVARPCERRGGDYDTWPPTSRMLIMLSCCLVGPACQH
jgi:hypothetical protein